MITKKWKVSERKYGIKVEKHVSIPLSDGIRIDADIFRPDGPGRFPALLGAHPYVKDIQSAPIMPAGLSIATGGIEAGDPNFYVRRGYAQVIANVRGTGKSNGEFEMLNPRADQDIYEIIEWMAAQPWCDGNIGTFGVSWFAMAAQNAVHLNPPHLKCIFAPFAVSDMYRDAIYHGGILSHAFTENVSQTFDNPRFPAQCWYRRVHGEEKYENALADALKDKDLMAVPYIGEALRTGRGPVDNYLCYLDGEYWTRQNTDYSYTGIPAYLGACWGIYGLHLPAAFRSWERWTGPKKMVIGPPIYLDRPVYQYGYESLRWFDYWLKGVDNKIMEDGDPIKLFVVNTGEWKTTTEWPLPETRWTPFYLHANGLLSEHEFWPNEGFTTFEDSPFNRDSLTFISPPLVETTEVIGPMVLNFYASTTDTEVLWFVTFLDIDPTGRETLLTRGWLRGSHRQIDPEKSEPWQPYHPHTRREPLTPDEVYEFNIEIMPYAIEFKPGHRIGVRIKCVDDEDPESCLEGIAVGHIWRQSTSRVTVFHNTDFPSHLLLPVTKGNLIETYISGGSQPKSPFPYRRW